MKKSVIIFLIMVLPAMLPAQTSQLNAIFDQYQEAEGVTSIKIAKAMFDMLKSLDLPDEELQEIKPVLDDINELKILIIDNPQNDSVQVNNAQYMKVKNDISRAVNNLNYQELMTVNRADNKIKFLSAKANSGSVVKDLLLSIDSEDATVLMMLDGLVDMKKVSQMINEMESKKEEE